MIKILKTFVFAILLISHIAIAIYSNLLYGRPSVVYFRIHTGCGTYSKVYATDRVITRYYVNDCSRVGYLFVGVGNPNASLTISLPVGTMVKSVLLSLED